MKTVQFYTRNNCQLCEDSFVLLEILQSKYNFKININNIETNEQWHEKYQVIIPVIKIGEIELNSNMIDIETIENAFKKTFTV